MLQLYRLTNTDIVALENEHNELANLIKEYRHILDNHDALLQVIKSELTDIRKRFKSERLSSMKRKSQKSKLIKKLWFQVKMLF